MSVCAILLLGLLAVLLLVGAATDIRSRIISNRLNAAIALLALPWWMAMGWGAHAILLQIGLAAAVLFAFALLFALGMMGGGDVKLLAALALWFPAMKMALLLEWMALGGGVLTLGMVIAHRIRNAPDRPEIPYGVAIAAAALLIVANGILTSSLA